MSYNRCPESVDGMHDSLTDRQGRCLFCHAKIDSKMPFYADPLKRDTARHAQNPLSIDGPDEADYLDGWGGPA